MTIKGDNGGMVNEKVKERVNVKAASLVSVLINKVVGL